MPYCGDDFRVVAREGFRAFLEDFLLRLNGAPSSSRRCSRPSRQRGLSAASLNYLILKGRLEHVATLPKPMRLLPGIKRTRPVHAPSIVAIGDFLTTRTRCGKPLASAGGLLHRFGMDDASTGQLLAELAEDGLPAFTVAYFADDDFESTKSARLKR